MTQDWTSLMAGERMELDGEFTDRVASSSLTAQQWSLVMTAVEFEIDAPGTPENATLVANTDTLPAVTDELDKIEDTGPGLGGGRGGGSGSGEGLFSRLTGALGGGGGSDERLAEAEELADEYAGRLQEKLIDTGRWEDVCARAASD
jgi:uncharacterized membrane protein YgcG